MAASFQRMDGRPMHPSQLHRARRRTKRRSRSPERLRAAIAAVSLAVIFLVGYFAGTQSYFFDFTRAAVTTPAAVAAVTQQQQQDKWSHRIGSILFVPWSGDTCEQRRFDNATGQMLSTGFVKCEEILAQDNLNVPGWTHDNTTRISAILNAFKK